MKTNIEIIYCASWNYSGRATSLVADMLDEFQSEIESIRLVPSTGGLFEISVDDELIFSKKMLERHAEPGEVIDIFRKIIASNK